jgi:hypothetical protein
MIAHHVSTLGWQSAVVVVVIAVVVILIIDQVLWSHGILASKARPSVGAITSFKDIVAARTPLDTEKGGCQINTTPAFALKGIGTKGRDGMFTMGTGKDDYIRGGGGTITVWYLSNLTILINGCGNTCASIATIQRIITLIDESFFGDWNISTLLVRGIQVQKFAVKAPKASTTQTPLL